VASVLVAVGAAALTVAVLSGAVVGVSAPAVGVAAVPPDVLVLVAAALAVAVGAVATVAVGDAPSPQAAVTIRMQRLSANSAPELRRIASMRLALVRLTLGIPSL